MTDYIIKHYNKGFEEEQEKIGNEVAMSFLLPNQTPVARLKEVYSQEGFDPETRLYAFKENKMIGFLTARILEEQNDGIKKANLTPPSVLSKYEGASEVLFRKAVEVLKKKGVQKILSRFGCITHQDTETAKKWGYKHIATDFYLYSIDLNNNKTITHSGNFIDMNFEKHKEELIRIYSTEFGQNEEWVINFLERLKNLQDGIFRKHLVIEEDDGLKGYALIVQNNVDSTKARLSPIYAKNEEYMKQLLSVITQVCKENKIKELYATFTEEDDVKQDKYRPIKFNLIGTASQFEKEI